MCGYLTTVVWLLSCFVVTELTKKLTLNPCAPRNCPLCASSVRPLPQALIFCRRTLHLCDRYPFRLLIKSVSAVSGRDIMVVKLLLFFFFVVLICFLFFWFGYVVCMLLFSVWLRPTSLISL